MNISRRGFLSKMFGAAVGAMVMSAVPVDAWIPPEAVRVYRYTIDVQTLEDMAAEWTWTPVDD